MNANAVDYYLIITYPGSRKQHLMTGPERAIAATEENKNVLLDMGQRLLDENVIGSYQLVQVVAEEVNNIGEIDEMC
jgi:hypothetical protein